MSNDKKPGEKYPHLSSEWLESAKGILRYAGLEEDIDGNTTRGWMAKRMADTLYWQMTSVRSRMAKLEAERQIRSGQAEQFAALHSNEEDVLAEMAAKVERLEQEVLFFTDAVLFFKTFFEKVTGKEWTAPTGGKREDAAAAKSIDYDAL